MPRFVSPVEFVNDELGRTIPGAELFFFENKTTTPKATYADRELTLINPQPVPSDAAGRFPNIWLLPGGYRVELRDENGVVVWVRDDVNVETQSLLSSTAIIFETHNTLKSGVTVGGELITFEEGQTLATQGYNAAGDNGDAVYIVVPDTAGTADDILFLDIGSGLLAQRLGIKQQVFTNATQLEAALWLGIGDTAISLDNATTDDAAGALYVVVPSGTGTADGLNLLDLANGNQAQLSEPIHVFQRYSEVIDAQTQGLTSTINIDLSKGPVADVITTAAISVINFVGLNPANGLSHTVTLKLNQDSNGFHNVIWPAGILWSNGLVPSVTQTPNATDIFIFTTFDGGTTWYAVTAGQDFK